MPPADWKKRYLEPIDYPNWIELTTFEAVREAFRSPCLIHEIGSEHERVFSSGSLDKIDGAEHLKRRRIWNNLLKRDGHKYFRDVALLPTVGANLQELMATRDPDGFARFDAVSFGKRTMMQLGAALVGIDRATTREGADEMLALIPRFGMQEAKLAPLFGFDAETVIPRVVEATHEYRVRFHEPALERRRALVERVAKGELDQAELPHDLLTLIAQHGEEAGWTEETGLRDSMLLVLTSADSTIGIITWTIEELRRWFEQHPEEFELRTDREFILHAVTETLRTHALSYSFMRHAVEDTILPGGIEVKAGQNLALRNQVASGDESVFGPDAKRFDPHREAPPGIQGYGLGFGAGPHMCFGIPVLMGSEGIDGSLVHTLVSWYEAGLEPDPERHPTRTSAEHHGDRFLMYPARLRPPV